MRSSRWRRGGQHTRRIRPPRPERPRLVDPATGHRGEGCRAPCRSSAALTPCRSRRRSNKNAHQLVLRSIVMTQPLAIPLCSLSFNKFYLKRKDSQVVRAPKVLPSVCTCELNGWSHSVSSVSY
jgi:hypothetical protein